MFLSKKRCMTTIIRPSTKNIDLVKTQQKVVPLKKLTTKEFSGTIKFNDSPLEIQKKLRVDWE
jgi:hypothetical protein